ncbi:hypothetical protein U3516DRAFT_753568 [Neocallimastix sp. 'constans']
MEIKNMKVFTKYNEDIFADVIKCSLLEHIKFSNVIVISPINFHCYFEKGISNKAKKIFPYINIKYYNEDCSI